MHDTIEERFVFLMSAHSDISHAIRAASEATEDYPPFVQYCMLRDAVVAYFRPFKAARAVHTPRVKLDKSVVPVAHQDFHDELERYRDSVYAHSDIRERQPKLQYWGLSGREFAVSMKPVDRKPLHIHRTAMIALFEAVIAEIGPEVQQLKKDLAKVGARLIEELQQQGE